MHVAAFVIIGYCAAILGAAIATILIVTILKQKKTKYQYQKNLERQNENKRTKETIEKKQPPKPKDEPEEIEVFSDDGPEFYQNRDMEIKNEPIDFSDICEIMDDQDSVSKKRSTEDKAYSIIQRKLNNS